MKHRARALTAMICMLCIACSSASHRKSAATFSVRAASHRLAQMMPQPTPLSRTDQMLTLVLGAGLVTLQLRRQHKTLSARRLSV
jgi:hypothetical protein